MLHEVTVRVKLLRHLPQQFFHEEKERESALARASSSPSGHTKSASSHRRCLRAQASIVKDTRETGNSVWGKGVRSREATWLKGADTLAWRLPEGEFKHVKAYTPVCKVHVYATDPSAPKMETSDSVGWFAVDMRDLAGQRLRDERWVKLQGAGPAEVLISSTLSMVKEQEQTGNDRGIDAKTAGDGVPMMNEQATLREGEKGDGMGGLSVNSVSATSAAQHESLLSQHSQWAEADRSISIGEGTVGDRSVADVCVGEGSVDELLEGTAPDITGHTGQATERTQQPGGMTIERDDLTEKEAIATKSSNVLTLPAAEAVSELDALPIGSDADTPDARIFSLSISVKGAARLLQLKPAQRSQEVGTLEVNGRTKTESESGLGFWFSYTIFGVVVQTDRFERLDDPSPGDGPVLEPMLDSFRLRATLLGLCDFLGKAPPLQVFLCTEHRILAHADVDMSCLLPRDQWNERQASDFGRTGMEGNFELRRPGEPLSDRRLDSSTDKAVVTICAQLTRADLTSADGSSVWSDSIGDDSGLLRTSRVETDTGEGFRNRGQAGFDLGIQTWTRRAPSRGQGGAGACTDGASESGGDDASFGSGSRLSGGRYDVDHSAERSGFSRPILSKEEDQKEESYNEKTGAGIRSKRRSIHSDEGRRKGGVQEREAISPEGDRGMVEDRVPRSYRLSINLASVKDLDNAAYVVASYHYPHFGTSAPVRTSLVWVPPRTDTPLANSCCMFSFGMSPDRLNTTVQDKPLAVSIRNKDRFKEEEVGVVTLPLQELVHAAPRYFRCRDTNKTFTSMAGFRAHVKSRQRTGTKVSEDAAPVEVKVMDTYVTVAGTEAFFSTSGTTRLCSMRVMLLLEDMGPTGEPTEQDVDDHVSTTPADHSTGPAQGSLSQVPTSFTPSTQLPGQGVLGAGFGAMPPSLHAVVGEGSQTRSDVQRVWVEWEQWRMTEEAAFAKRLREKDQALEEKWTERESARRRDVQQAQQDYGKLETKLRKALSEVEARERTLKAREEGSRADHAQKLSELQLLQRRLREETKHQVDLERMKAKALEKQVKSHAKALEDARARVAATDEDFEKFRQQTRKTPEGGLRQEVFRLGAAKAEAEAKVERERSEKHKALLEKEEYRAHVHKLARALKRHQERESTCARREMEQLRIEYLAREERFMLDGDRNELRTIKQELDELRHLSLVQEASAGLSRQEPASTPPHSTTTPSNPRHSHIGMIPQPFNASGLSQGGMGIRDCENLPGPSPSPPPQPTPAPAPASVSSHRWDRGISVSSERHDDSVRAVRQGSVADFKSEGVKSSRHGRGSSIERAVVTSSETRTLPPGQQRLIFTEGIGSRGGDDKRTVVGVTQSSHGDRERKDSGPGELERLVDWRNELLATGMYAEENPIVTELTRRIAGARGTAGGEVLLQREE